MQIITIGREFGSGGRELGKRLADELGFAYYDKEILTAVAQQSGLNEEYIEMMNDRGISKHYHITYGRTFSSGFTVQYQRNKTELLLKQQKILKDLVQKGDCVVVGRGADVILEEYHPFNLFIYASMSSKVSRCRKYADKNEKLTVRELEAKIQQVDRSRKQYYELLKGEKWGSKENYHLCINTTGMEIKKMIPGVAGYVQNWFGGTKNENTVI